MLQLRGDRQRLVLIVDDDPVFGVLAAETLRQAGFSISVAEKTQDALEFIREMKPDLMLLDVELPDGQGFDLCVLLRATPQWSDIPIVMVTGKHDTSSIARAFEVGATDFINKPVLWPTLPHRIEFIMQAQATMRALRVSERKNRVMLQALPDAIYILNSAGVVLEHMAGGHQRNDGVVPGQTIEAMIPCEAVQAARAFMCTPQLPGTLATHEFNVGRDHDARALEARIFAQTDGTFLLIVRNISDRKRAEARIEYLAYFDALTGLPNRQMLMRDANSVLSAAQQSNTLASLLYLDLDRFKRINDNLGHSIGDALLREVARRLQRVLGSALIDSMTASAGTGGLLARLGGDEFVILFAGIRDEKHVSAVVTEIENQLGEPFECDGHRFVVTPSIGVALYPKDGYEIDDLLVNADMAMYRAKDRGRNGHAFYGETMAIKALGRLEMEGELRRALDEGQFQLHYQPKMSLDDKRIHGVEALLRWNHPERGWVPPDKFIPIAEETGLIVAIGDWVISESTRQIRAWQSGPLKHLSIAVNVSVHQFSKDSFVEDILRTLSQGGVKPKQLELEITESCLMRDVDRTRGALKRLGAAGLRLSIDDFGTGYSSLGYLRQFPVDALKIDRSFVADLPNGTDSAAICAAILAMARELQLTVIAEGVETDAQLRFLREHGCDQAQGYLISKPVPADELSLLMMSDLGFEQMTMRGPARLAAAANQDSNLV